MYPCHKTSSAEAEIALSDPHFPVYFILLSCFMTRVDEW